MLEAVICRCSLGVLKNFPNFTQILHEKTWGPATLLRRDSNTGAFPWNLRNF